MKIHLICFLFAIVLVSAPSMAQESAPPMETIEKIKEPTTTENTVTEETTMKSVVYLSELGDIPLMEGMEQIDDSALMFDKPAGRIVEVSFVTKSHADDVLVYYAESLPPLGWHLSGPDSYVRHGEELTLQLEKSESDEQLVHFRLAPLEAETETTPETPVNKEKSAQ